MAGLKTIRRRLVSVKNTRKITSAMKLVSAAKLRKAQDAVNKAREYTNAVNLLLSSLLAEQGSLDITHPLMQSPSEVKNIRLLIVGGSRGLCGGYNTNINKAVDSFYREKKEFKVESVIVGRKQAEYFRRIKRNCINSYEKLPDDANLWPIEEICRELESSFLKGECDQVYIVYTRFKSALSMQIKVERLLPFDNEVLPAADVKTTATATPILFEPSVAEVFGSVIPRIFRSKVRQACLDAKASEHGSRMTAMDAATKNAAEISDKLKLAYNKLRQTRITSELLDIVGGAEALS